jgi:hypothetical protein
MGETFLRSLGHVSLSRFWHGVLPRHIWLRRLSGRLDVSRTALSSPFHRSKSTAAYIKPASSSLDRVSLAPTADSWAVRSGPAVSVALAGSAGFQVSAPDWGAADRYFVGCDFLNLTFYFSFAGLSAVGTLFQSC